MATRIPGESLLVNRALRRLGTSLCGRYRIERLIGMGGMAAVYAGVHRNGHPVAIKVLHDTLSSDPDIERAFRREAQLANTIGHPGVVPVLDDDVTSDGCVFLVMPLLTGETARARSARLGGKLSVEEVVVIAAATLEALAAAHAKQIVHRDVKPENLFVSGDGTVRVLDFGIGRLFATSDTPSSTESGRALGTPAFMAPEQALGRTRDIDHRTDLWAVGATMFTLLTGRLVHDAPSAAEIGVRAATSPAPRLGTVAPDVPAPICEVVDRALRFVRDERWPNARDMARALLEARATALGREESPLPVLTVPLAADPRTSFGESDPLRDPNADSPGEPPAIDDARAPTEILGEASQPTRTAVAGAHRPIDRRRIPRARLLTAVFAGVVVAAALVLVVRPGGVRSGPADSGRSTAALDAWDTVEEPWALGPSMIADVRSREAVDDVRAGLQLWLDASPQEARRRFQHATRLEPTFALAHLYYVVMDPTVNADGRQHLRRAAEHRSKLGAFETRLLTALEPATTEPPDLRETEKRLSNLLAAHPADVLLASAVAARRNGLEDADDELPALAQLPDAAPGAAIVHVFRAARALESWRIDDARREYQLCLARSSASTSCLRGLTILEAQSGRCSEGEEYARRWAAAWPESSEAFHWLGATLFGRSHQASDARPALERSWALTGEDQRPIARASDLVALALGDGDLTGAERLLHEWERAAAMSADMLTRGEPAMVRLELATEFATPDEAANLARRYRAESDVWSTSDNIDMAVLVARTLVRAAAMTDNQARVERAAWMQVDTRGMYATEARRWFNFYGELGVTPGLAKDALATLPQHHPFFNPLACDNQCEAVIGESFLLADAARDAEPHLRRAVATCSYEFPIDAIRAELLLGRARETFGAFDEACAHYRSVLRREPPTGRSARDARVRLDRLRCPAMPSGK